MPGARHPRVGRHLEGVAPDLVQLEESFEFFLRALDHRPELADLEGSPVQTDTALSEQDRTAGVELDPGRDRQHHRRQDDRQERAPDEVDGAFGEHGPRRGPGPARME